MLFWNCDSCKALLLISSYIYSPIMFSLYIPWLQKQSLMRKISLSHLLKYKQLGNNFLPQNKKK